MKNLYKWLTFSFLIHTIGCSGQSEHSIYKPSNNAGKNDERRERIRSLAELSSVNSAVDYEAVKKSIQKERAQLASKNLSVDSLGKIFKASLLNRIIPFWEGTEWSFEGHTATPRAGKIACGYFVSTTLQDAGLNVNKFALAQQSPINEARSLSVNSVVKEITGTSISQNIAAIRDYLKEGIHFIGFDRSHVGYILKEKGNLYLIHSNYIHSAGVLIEPIEESDVFRSYNRFFIVELSSNENFLRHWVTGRKISIFVQD